MSVPQEKQNVQSNATGSTKPECYGLISLETNHPLFEFDRAMNVSLPLLFPSRAAAESGAGKRFGRNWREWASVEPRGVKEFHHAEAMRWAREAYHAYQRTIGNTAPMSFQIPVQFHVVVPDVPEAEEEPEIPFWASVWGHIATPFTFLSRMTRHGWMMLHALLITLPLNEGSTRR